MSHQGTKTPREAISFEVDQIASQAVDAAFSVHSQLGPGLLESIYEICMAHELAKRGLKTCRQVSLPITYDDLQLEAGFRIDLLVEDKVVIEIKAVEKVLPVHFSQLLTYLKLSRCRLGLLINFNSPLIKDGISRLVV